MLSEGRDERGRFSKFKIGQFKLFHWVAGIGAVPGFLVPGSGVFKVRV